MLYCDKEGDTHKFLKFNSKKLLAVIGISLVGLTGLLMTNDSIPFNPLKKKKKNFSYSSSNNSTVWIRADFTNDGEPDFYFNLYQNITAYCYKENVSYLQIDWELTAYDSHDNINSTFFAEIWAIFLYGNMKYQKQSFIDINPILGETPDAMWGVEITNKERCVLRHYLKDDCTKVSGTYYLYKPQNKKLDWQIKKIRSIQNNIMIDVMIDNDSHFPYIDGLYVGKGQLTITGDELRDAQTDPFINIFSIIPTHHIKTENSKYLL